MFKTKVVNTQNLSLPTFLRLFLPVETDCLTGNDGQVESTLNFPDTRPCSPGGWVSISPWCQLMPDKKTLALVRGIDDGPVPHCKSFSSGYKNQFLNVSCWGQESWVGRADSSFLGTATVLHSVPCPRFGQIPRLVISLAPSQNFPIVLTVLNQ